MLRTYGVKLGESDEKRARDLQESWEHVYLSALYRSVTLEGPKERFRDMVTKEDDVFLQEIRDFVQDYEDNGPGGVDDLELGLEKTKVGEL